MKKIKNYIYIFVLLFIEHVVVEKHNAVNINNNNNYNYRVKATLEV